MKQPILLLFTLFWTSNTLQADVPPSTTTPDSSHSRIRAAWYATSEKYVNGERGKPCDILFIGDSITWNWLKQGDKVWQKYYVPRHALDFGVLADTTGNVLWRLDTWNVKDLHPKVQVVLIGTNNQQNTPEEQPALRWMKVDSFECNGLSENNLSLNARRDLAASGMAIDQKPR